MWGSAVCVCVCVCVVISCQGELSSSLLGYAGTMRGELHFHLAASPGLRCSEDWYAAPTHGHSERHEGMLAMTGMQSMYPM